MTCCATLRSFYTLNWKYATSRSSSEAQVSGSINCKYNGFTGVLAASGPRTYSISVQYRRHYIIYFLDDEDKKYYNMMQRKDVIMLSFTKNKLWYLLWVRNGRTGMRCRTDRNITIFFLFSFTTTLVDIRMLELWEHSRTTIDIGSEFFLTEILLYYTVVIGLGPDSKVRIVRRRSFFI